MKRGIVVILILLFSLGIVSVSSTSYELRLNNPTKSYTFEGVSYDISVEMQDEEEQIVLFTIDGETYEKSVKTGGSFLLKDGNEFSFVPNMVIGNQGTLYISVKVEGVSSCQEEWACEGWSECVNGKQYRNCRDNNGCGTTDNKPSVTQDCETSPMEDSSCIDSDKGLNYNVKGDCKDDYFNDDEDECVGSKLYEQVCKWNKDSQDYTCSHEIYNCQRGCKEGKCIEDDGEICLNEIVSCPQSEERITIENDENGCPSKCIMQLASGKIQKEIKIMPETALQTAKEKFGDIEYNLTLEAKGSIGSTDK